MIPDGESYEEGDWTAVSSASLEEEWNQPENDSMEASRDDKFSFVHEVLNNGKIVYERAH